MTRGKFIVFEGIDGSGKTTHANLLAKRLGTTVMPSTDGLIGDTIRSALQGDIPIPARGLQMLFTAGRMARTAMIEAKLAGGHHVVADRWTMSAIYYGSLGFFKERERQCEKLWLQNLNGDVLVPDLYIVMSVLVEEALHRIASRSKKEIYENRSNLATVHQDYKLASSSDICSVRHIFVNAQLSIEATHDIVLDILSREGIEVTL